MGVTPPSIHVKNNSAE